MVSDLLPILRAYGFLGTDADQQTACEQMRIGVSAAEFADMPVDVSTAPGSQLYYARPGLIDLGNFGRRQPIYHALLPHLTFSGSNLQPVWVDRGGRALIAWHRDNGKNRLLIGLNIIGEMIRHRQGNPQNVSKAQSRSAWGYDNERPLYLFEDQLVAEYRTIPWADHLGFFLAGMFSKLSGLPFMEPLPYGARGAVILTGDDDQADLSDYAEQIKVVGHLPITYFLHPLTQHTVTTLKELPSNVEVGLHPDALDKPEAYDELCLEQAERIESLAGRPVRIVRNHGFLSRGYLGHLSVWEKGRLNLDVNYPGVDGTALNGSFLPMRVLRPNGTWSQHYSLLTAFGDGMIYALKLNQHQAIERVRRLARQIETSAPGVLVFNFHPANIAQTRELHKAVVTLAARAGWIALGLESYLRWLETVEGLQAESLGRGRFRLTSEKEVKALVLRYPGALALRKRRITPWIGKTEVSLN